MNKLLSTIPFNRLVIYSSALLLTFFCLLCIYFYNRHAQLNEVSESLRSSYHLSTQKIQKQSLNQLVRKKYAKTDSLYLEHTFKGFIPLQSEIRSLTKIKSGPCYTSTESIEKRLAFLTEGANALTFVEKQSLSADKIKESEVDLSQPVEIESADLKKILDILEGDHPSKPQTVVKEFHLTKKAKPLGGEVFELNFSLIKREFES
jgi:hypothetical protein